MISVYLASVASGHVHRRAGFTLTGCSMSCSKRWRSKRAWMPNARIEVRGPYRSPRRSRWGLRRRGAWKVCRGLMHAWNPEAGSARRLRISALLSIVNTKTIPQVRYTCRIYIAFLHNLIPRWIFESSWLQDHQERIESVCWEGNWNFWGANRLVFLRTDLNQFSKIRKISKIIFP